jgi:hypothetical protein
MHRHRHTFACLVLSLVALGGFASAQADSKSDKKTQSEEKDPNAKPLIPKNAAVDATVWGAVIYATAEAKTEKSANTKPTAELQDLKGRLAKIKQFESFKNFELVGQHTQKIFSEYTNWVVPSKELFLNVDSKGPAEDGGVNLHVQLWRRSKVLVKTDTTLKRESPLIIGGPKWRDGQLIFVLVLK